MQGREPDLAGVVAHFKQTYGVSHLPKLTRALQIALEFLPGFWDLAFLGSLSASM